MLPKWFMESVHLKVLFSILSQLLSYSSLQAVYRSCLQAKLEQAREILPIHSGCPLWPGLRSVFRHFQPNDVLTAENRAKTKLESIEIESSFYWCNSGNNTSNSWPLGARDQTRKVDSVSACFPLPHAKASESWGYPVNQRRNGDFIHVGDLGGRLLLLPGGYKWKKHAGNA